MNLNSVVEFEELSELEFSPSISMHFLCLVSVFFSFQCFSLGHDAFFT